MVTKVWCKWMCALFPVLLFSVGADVSCNPTDLLPNPLSDELAPGSSQQDRGEDAQDSDRDDPNREDFDDDDDSDWDDSRHERGDDGDDSDHDGSDWEDSGDNDDDDGDDDDDDSGCDRGVTYRLATAVIGGHGTLAPASGPQDANAVVQLTATPDSGYLVKRWTGTDDDSSTANTNTVTMTGAKSVTVEFELTSTEPYQLTTSVIGGNGTLAPASGPQNANTVVQLTATPDSGYEVKQWTGTDNDASTATVNSVTMTGAKIVTVEFQAVARVGDASAGQALYTQSCQMCHGGGSFLHGRGSRIVNDMGTIRSAMRGIILTDQEVLDLRAYAAMQ